MCHVKHLQAPAKSIYVYHSAEQDFHSVTYLAILFDKLLCKEQTERQCGCGLRTPAWVAITDGL